MEHLTTERVVLSGMIKLAEVSSVLATVHSWRMVSEDTQQESSRVQASLRFVKKSHVLDSHDRVCKAKD